MLEKAGKINEEVQQKVDKAKEDILEEIKKGFK
jgi:Ni,Fe-hydrogenase maturation factor